jgi:hypothetical protein
VEGGGWIERFHKVISQRRFPQRCSTSIYSISKSINQINRDTRERIDVSIFNVPARLNPR